MFHFFSGCCRLQLSAVRWLNVSFLTSGINAATKELFIVLNKTKIFKGYVCIKQSSWKLVFMKTQALVRKQKLGLLTQRLSDFQNLWGCRGSRVLTFLSDKKRGEKRVTIDVGESEISGWCVYCIVYILYTRSYTGYLVRKSKEQFRCG